MSTSPLFLPAIYAVVFSLPCPTKLSYPVFQAEFDHVKKGLHADEEERAAEEADPMFYIRGATEDTKRALEGEPGGVEPGGVSRRPCSGFLGRRVLHPGHG